MLESYVLEKGLPALKFSYCLVVLYASSAFGKNQENNKAMNDNKRDCVKNSGMKKTPGDMDKQ